MAKNDTGLLQLSDIAQAVALLTRLPVLVSGTPRGGEAAWAYPIVGLILGALAALVGLLAQWMGLPIPLIALLCLGTLILLTGAMHEDGLADTADGLWGGWTREARLEIMKDSHIGTYGVLALLFSFAARWAALWLLIDTSPGAGLAALIAAAVLSRAAMVTVMGALPHARESGLSHSVGSVQRPALALAWGLAAAIGVFCAGFALIGALLWCALLIWIITAIARRKIGGQTGDILGATQQVCEIAILFSLLV